MIEINGSTAGTNNGGILFFEHGSHGSLVKGLVLNNSVYQVNGFLDCIDILDGDIRVESCYLGTDPTGTTGSTTGFGGGVGIFLDDNSYVGDVVIGSTGKALSDGAQGNLISGSVGGAGVMAANDGNANITITIGQNFIGTNANGTSAVPNTAGINTRGATHSVYHNLISGQIDWGVGALSPGPKDVIMSIKACYIGTDITGMLAIPNGTSGGGYNQAILFWNPSATSKLTVGSTDHDPYTCNREANLISGNTGKVLWTNHGTGSSFVGNFIGVDITGNNALPNGQGIDAGNQVQFTVGGETALEANIISNNGYSDIAVGNSTDVHVVNNRFGTNASGTANFPFLASTYNSISFGNVTGDVLIKNNILNQFKDHAITVSNYTPGGADSMRILGNYFNILADGLTPGTNIDAVHAITLTTCNQFTVGDGTAAGKNLITGGASIGLSNGIHMSGSYDFNILNNYFGFNSTGTSPASFGLSSIAIQIEDSNNGKIENNLIGNSVGNGITIGNNSNTMYIFQNKIGMDITGTSARPNENGIVLYSGAQDITMSENAIAFNNTLGIDLNGDGITMNDSGDADAGPNNLLNFPLIAKQVGDNITIKLDVPAGDYRIEFFANPSGLDPTSYGEGEVYLGYGNITHTGSGIENFVINVSGSSTASNITATTTFIDASSPFGFGPTSEFSGPCSIQMNCPQDVTILCDDSRDTVVTGSVSVNTSAYCPVTISYTDGALSGGCSANTGSFIRTFRVALTDNPAVFQECQQTITVVDNVPPIFSSVNGNIVKKNPPSLEVPSNDDLINYLEDLTSYSEILYASTAGKLGPDPGDVTDYVPGSTSNQLWRLATYPIYPDCSGSSVSIDALINYSYTYQTPPSVPGDDYNYAYAFIVGSDGSTYAIDYPSIAILEGEVLPNTNYKLHVIANDLPYNTNISYTLCIMSATIAQDDIDHINYDDTYSFDHFNVYMDNTNCPKTTTYYSCAADLPSAPTLTADDNCGSGIVTFDETINGTEPCDYTLIRTWTATDDCGNTNQYVENYTIKDNAPPTFDDFNVVPTYDATATDLVIDYAYSLSGEVLVPPAVPGEFGPLSGSTQDNGAPAGQSTLSEIAAYHIPNNCGPGVSTDINSSVTITLDNVETTYPPGNSMDAFFYLAGETGGSFTILAFDFFTFQQGVPGQKKTLSVHGQNLSFDNYYLIIGGSVIEDTDQQHYTSSYVINNTTLACRDTVYAVCASDIPAAQSFAATDNCGTADVDMAETTTGTEPCDYSLTRTWTATDACGNSFEISKTYIVLDDVAPAFDSEMIAPTYNSTATQSITDWLSTLNNWYYTPMVTEGQFGPTPGTPQDYGAPAGMTTMGIAAAYPVPVDCANSGKINIGSSVTFTLDEVESTNPSGNNMDASILIIGETAGAYSILGFDVHTFHGGVAGQQATVSVDAQNLPYHDNYYILVMGNTIEDTDEQHYTSSYNVNYISAYCVDTVALYCEEEIPDAADKTYTDNCGGTGTATVSDTRDPATGDNFTLTRVWTATDECGNTATTQVVYAVEVAAPCSPLPLNLLSFTVQKSGAVSLLNWNTANEVNTDKFIVQHSLDGRSFSEIGTVSANNIGSTVNKYGFTDMKPSNGVNYYRLRNMDKNGSYTYSPIRSVIFDTNYTFEVYPNPVNGNDQAIVTGSGFKVLYLYDNLGKLVKTYGDIDSGADSRMIRLKDLAPGFYYLKNDNSQIVRLVIN